MSNSNINNPRSKHFIRKEHNLELVRRMQQGDDLCKVDSKASWFPPRPVIKKDEKEVAKLYGQAASRTTKPIVITVADAMSALQEIKAGAKVMTLTIAKVDDAPNKDDSLPSAS